MGASRRVLQVDVRVNQMPSDERFFVDDRELQRLFTP
jgi:hypothetical protein